MTTKTRMDIHTRMDLPNGRPKSKCEICGEKCQNKNFYPMRNGKSLNVAICSFECKEIFKNKNKS